MRKCNAASAVALDFGIFKMPKTGTVKNRPRFLSVLLTETELLDDGTISFDILLCQVSQQILSVTNHLGKTPLRMEILRILLHMLSEQIDAGSENRYLHFRGTGVIFSHSVCFDDLLFYDLFHVFSPFYGYAVYICPKLSLRRVKRHEALFPQTVSRVKHGYYNILKWICKYFLKIFSSIFIKTVSLFCHFR